MAFVPIRTLLSLPRLVERSIKRLRSIIRPRLGNLNQYAPRPLLLEKYAISTPDLTHTPKISIITPSYNQGVYIERTIKSVLDQPYPNLEYFIQDGGSKDDTKKIIRQYESKLSGWASKKDNGQSHAINLGLGKTNGEIMAWLNSDDLLLPGALHTVANYFNRHPEVDVVYGNRLMIDENDMEIGRWILPGHDNDVLSWADYVPQETLFWRRRIWDKAGSCIDESFRFAMDWDLLIRFRDAGARFGHIPHFLGAFRIHDLQKTSAAINDIGHEEMERIRQRVHGKTLPQKTIKKAIRLFMLKHMATDLRYRIETKLFNK